MRPFSKSTSAFLVVLACAPWGFASDHADPTDLPFQPGGVPSEAVLSDLFVFPVNAEGKLVTWKKPPATPVDKKGEPTFRCDLKDGEADAITDLVVILCVRPALLNGDKLKLKPYTYTVNFDLTCTVDFEDPWNRARYGGTVKRPETISADATIQFELNNDATLKSGFPKFEGLNNTKTIEERYIESGIFDDPFIFRDFARTNAVGMIVKIPISCFPRGSDQKNFVIWATSHCGKKQFDHAGRSLRTQNPRFGVRYQNLWQSLLNTRHPAEHDNAVDAEHNNPSLVRDVFLGAGFESYFAIRQWDDEPDVMIYSTNFPAGFPNGRVPDDDVVELTARYGDGLAFELSYLDDGPRLSAHDPPFPESFPYLAEKRSTTQAKEEHHLSPGSWGKIFLVVFLILLGLALENALIIFWYQRKQQRNKLL